MTIVGIDPGINGGVGVLLDDAIGKTCPLPISSAAGIHTTELLDLLATVPKPRRFIVEQVQLRSAQGHAVAMVTKYGELIGHLKAWGEQVETIPASVWKRRANLLKADKAASVALANTLFGLKLRNSQDGQAEALLIAKFGVKR